MNRIVLIIFLLTSPHLAYAYFTGTAFAVNDQGHLVTNHHVISDAKTIIVRDHLNNFFTAKIVKQDENADLAVLKIESATPNYLLLGDSRSVKKGEKIYAIGFPHVDFQGSESKVTEGIINSLSGYKGNQALYQISAEIQSGNSGGPLIRKDGSVIGVITSKLSAEKLLSQTGDLTQNVNYATKANEILKLYPQLLDNIAKTKTPIKLSTEDMIARADKAVYLVIASEYSVERKKIGLLKPYIKIPKNQTIQSLPSKESTLYKPEITAKNLTEMGIEAYQADNFKDALQYFTQASERGDVFAQYHLGIFFSKGLATDPEYTKARFWFQKAAKNGDLESKAELGRLYLLGLGGEKDLFKGERLLLEASEKGNMSAQSDLGAAYFILLKDHEKALYWLEKAALHGDGQANGLLAMIYSSGKIITQDMNKAFQYSQNAVKAGHTLGYIFSAMAYNFGAGVSEDKEKAYELITEAVNRNDMWYFAATYFFGKIEENNHELKDAYAWIQKSADTGFPEAQFWIGKYFLYQVNKDEKRAIEWLTKAAHEDYLPAQDFLGWHYREKKEFTKAFEWFKRAADLGYPESQVSVAWFYFHGISGVKKDLQQSFAWNLEAAKQGHDIAMFNIGHSYMHGHGVTTDKQQAFEWLMKAAKNNVPQAQNNLGAMYLLGDGIEKNENEGEMWLKKAASLKDELAIENLKVKESGKNAYQIY